MTAEAALLGIAALGRGRRVLVHAAAGGVGLAALQVTGETWGRKGGMKFELLNNH
jgi:NADPH:quinone reductase-like Zn-dependent oxidoreductase